MDWTPEAIEALRGYWAEGHSTAEIGRRMGISKNAVVGKAHRLNLPPRPSPIRREAAAAQSATPQPASRAATVISQAPAVAAPAPAPVAAPRAPAAPAASPAPVARPAPAPAMARPAPAAPVRKPAPVPQAVVRPFPRSSARTCCWPIGEPGTPDFRFCTGDAMTGKPYCPEHAAVAYVKVRDRREDAA
ncbi:GcrA family cell cycle regulator [Roseomonas marmotae]|uniref:GcrA cell cycle regulator n=1 Tax=Roseomonas marmotae TaxID=2768161 RepID=A0ABS3K7V3_9PROT|nr:GcrA family cell cycle regulator [Roseomonas marmotae]MBO1073082.1 GcrA cell cycle regulator [Roseomonas marmotae]QTI79277.1 GcrA cell cycle regulator [Roseomonas marmotae]